MADKLIIDCGSGTEEVASLTQEDEAQRATDAVALQALADEETRAETIRGQIDAEIARMKTELNNWAADLPNNATAATIVGRINLISAQVRRNTERIRHLGRLARGLYDAEE